MLLRWQGKGNLELVLGKINIKSGKISRMGVLKIITEGYKMKFENLLIFVS